jgi:hypothetical protein
MKTRFKPSRNSIGVVVAAVMAAGASGARATVMTTAPQVFHFGPGDDNFTQSALLAAFDQAGTLLGVHLELEGQAGFLLTATSGSNPGTVLAMREQAFFSLSGLPSASLFIAAPLYTVAPFDLAPDSSRSFAGTFMPPSVSTNLSELFDLNAYDVSAGAPAYLPFLFTSLESFYFEKTGSGLFGGSDVVGQGTARAWYTYDSVPPPPPAVPEIGTAASTGAFILVGMMFMGVRKLRQARSPVAQPLKG